MLYVVFVKVTFNFLNNAVYEMVGKSVCCCCDVFVFYPIACMPYSIFNFCKNEVDQSI